MPISTELAVRPAVLRDVDAAVGLLAAAFAADPVVDFLLGPSGAGPSEPKRRFFSLLMRVRFAMVQPVLVLHGGSRIAGLVMGYDAAGHEWPDAYRQEWDALEVASPGMAARAEVYEGVSVARKPTSAHFYLGVIGIDPVLQGQGAGARLLSAFCALSDADPRSAGVYLETGTPANLPFYERHGFAVRGEGDLGGTPLWCLFRAPPG